MRKSRFLPCLLLIVALPLCRAAAGSIALPDLGVRLELEADWTLVTPATLEEQAGFLYAQGVSVQALATAYAVDNTLFEVFLPGGARVGFSTLVTQDSARYGDVGDMDGAAKASLLAAFSGLPYEHAAWSGGQPDYLRFDWTMEAGGVAWRYARLLTIRQGRLFMLTATGQGLSADALREANEAVYARLAYYEAGPAGGTDEGDAGTVPDPIEDDGMATPVRLVDFSGVSRSDATQIVIQTLPGAELSLKTANDTLRGRADDEGRGSFTLSTRRETTYAYTLSVTAANRATSRMDITIDRRLTQEALDTAYRRSAKSLASYGYGQVADDPEAYANAPVFFTGSAAAFRDLDGTACVLVQVSEGLIWVVLEKPVPLGEEAALTVYGDFRGDAFSFAGQDVPVVVCRILAL